MRFSLKRTPKSTDNVASVEFYAILLVYIQQSTHLCPIWDHWPLITYIACFSLKEPTNKVQLPEKHTPDYFIPPPGEKHQKRGRRPRTRCYTADSIFSNQALDN